MTLKAIVSFLVILILLMFLVYPLLIIFRCNFVKFVPLENKTDIFLNEECKKCFSSVKLVTDSDAHKSFLQISLKDTVNYLDVYVALKYKKHVALKRYKISSVKNNDFSIKVSNNVLNAKIYINKINDEPKRERNIRYIPKKRLVIFSILELCSLFLINVLVTILFLNYYLRTANSIIYLTIILGFIFVTLCDGLFVYFLIYQPLEKFNYGGLIDD